MEDPGPVGADDDVELTPQEASASPETTPTASTASLGALPFLEADEPAPAPHPDPATAHEFLELVACGVAAYGARCEIAHRVSHGEAHGSDEDALTARMHRSSSATEIVSRPP